MRDPRTSSVWDATSAGALMESLSAAGGARGRCHPAVEPVTAVAAPTPVRDARGVRGALRRFWRW